MAAKKEMKNDLQTLKEELRAKQPGRLYIFHGEETFLLHHYLEQLKKQLLDELTESFNFHKLTTETFDIRSFADSVENLPMMAEHTLVWVDEVDIFKLAESDREKMGDILSLKVFTAIWWTRNGSMRAHTLRRTLAYGAYPCTL